MTNALTTPPGLLRPDVNPEVLLMIGTAGHVDHGKTKLVKMLTGCETDRLKEEQERGMTIELGFAPCFLGNNLCVGIVDVPGHERFVRTMVAGVSGIDLTVLVIAADDGIMPQTVEHLQIMELLGVRHGIVALTKIDLVDAGQVARRTAEIETLLQGTFLEGAPICPVSSETGDGYGAFYDLLVTHIRALQRRSNSGVFRMPVERVFSQPGFGAVVSGIPLAGSVRVGDAVALSPGGQVGHVRGLQCFLRDAAEGAAGQCLALNVPEWGKTPPVRGQVIVPPGYLPAATLFYVRFHTVPRLDPPLRHAEDIQFHTGTAEAHGKLFLLESQTVSGGMDALATILTDRPVAGASGDRFILRRCSPMATVAGGRIRLAEMREIRPRRQQMLDKLREREAFFDGIDETSEAGLRRRIEYAVLHRGAHGATTDDAAHDTLTPPATTAAVLNALRLENRILDLKAGAVLHTTCFQACRAEVEKRLAHARETEGRLNLAVNECRQGLDWAPAVWNTVIRDLEKAGTIAVQGETILLQTKVDSLPESDRRLAERLQKIFEESGFHSPHPDELPVLLGMPPPAVKRMLDFLLRQRKLVQVADNVVLAYTHYRKAQDLVVDSIKRDGVLNSPAFRDRLETTRKYAMSLLDFMDRQKITIRLQNDRRLMAGYERNLL